MRVTLLNQMSSCFHKWLSHFTSHQLQRVRVPITPHFHKHLVWSVFLSLDIWIGVWWHLHGSQPCHGEGACVTQWSYEPCCTGLCKMGGSQWSTGGGNHNSLQYSCLENPTDSTKRQKDMTMEDEPPSPPRLEGVQYATGEEQSAITNSSRKNEVAGSKQK